MNSFIVHVETTNPQALTQLIAHLEARPLDTDDTGALHPLAVEIRDTRSVALLWASVWEPENDDTEGGT